MRPQARGSPERCNWCDGTGSLDIGSGRAVSCPLCDSDQSGEAGQTLQAAGPEGRERGPSEASASPNHPS